MPLNIWYRYLFENGQSLDYGSDLSLTLSQIRTFNPQDEQGYKELLIFSEKIFKVGFEKLSSQPFELVKWKT